MKHTLRVTILLVSFFLMAQIVGLLVVNQYIDHQQTAGAGEIVMKPLPYGLERPEIENQSASFIYIIIAVFVGTMLVLLLIRFNKPFVWKFWFFITVWLTLSIAFASFINAFLAGALALLITFLRLFKQNIIVQNFSEIFIYGGLAAVFVPIINIFAAFMLLILISIYDFVAVFKTKHMIKLAEFQSKSKVFAGLFIPYERERISVKAPAKSQSWYKKTGKADKGSSGNMSVAVLGGGDIGFTLIFAGVVMKELMLQETVLVGFLKASIIPVCVSLALFALLVKGQQNKFYPAMPVLSLGCFVGYLIVLII